MSEVEQPSAEVASPCVGICRVDGEDMCLGCGRMIDEIMEWPRASDPRRRDIVNRAVERLADRVRQYPA